MAKRHSASQPARGRFVTFEGGEGVGKSTQVRLLSERLAARGLGVITTREPGGTPGAEAIRGLLVTGDTARWAPMTEALLHFAARSEHLDKVILPGLHDGKWVVSDRFADSTMAYQGDGQGVGREIIEVLYDLVAGSFRPDITIILDMPAGAGLARAGKRNGGSEPGDTEDRYERMGRAFHAKLRHAFLDIAASEPDRCVVIDASRDIDAVANDIWQAVCTRLGL